MRGTRGVGVWICGNRVVYELEVMARAAGVITGPKVRGRKPKSF